MERDMLLARAGESATAGWMRLLADITERPGRPDADAALLWRWLARLIGLRGVLHAHPAGARVVWPSPTPAGVARDSAGAEPEFVPLTPRGRIATAALDDRATERWRALAALLCKGAHPHVELLRATVAFEPARHGDFLLLRSGFAPLPGDALQALDMLFGWLEQSSREGGTRRVDCVFDGLRRAAGVDGGAQAHAPPVAPRPTRAVQLLADGLRLTEAEARVVWAVYRLDRIDKAAASLNISPHTLRTHLKHVFEKLGVHTRAALMVRVATLVQGAPLLAEKAQRSQTVV
jgi:DNA-binding CsgD family transcriptional regulator